MAPAVTSDTAPCSRAPHLLATDPTSLLNVALVDLCGSSLDMNSQPTPSSQDGSSGTADGLGTVPFHPFACLPATRSAVSSESQLVVNSSTNQDSHHVDGAGQLPRELINGIGVSSSQNLSSLTLSNACRVSLKAAPPRTVSIVIKNNGACTTAGITSNSGICPAQQSLATSRSCNGGHCSESYTISLSAQLPRPEVTHPSFVTRPVSSMRRMVITPRIPSHDAAPLPHNAAASCVVASVTDPVTKCDAKESELPDDEQPQIVRTDDHVTESDDHIPGPSATHSDAVSLDGVHARQCDLVGRADRMLLRLRRLQSREVNSSARRQVAGLVSVLRRSAAQAAASADSSAVRSAPDLKSMSTLELVGFVRQMQSSEAVSKSDQISRSSVLPLSVCPDMAETADRLSSDLHHLESAVDSDVTESSSGGETDDEVDSPPTVNDEYVVISDSNNRLKTKLAWASERAMIASRWTWLQAQVSDLEYRIRQQSDLYRQLRSLKGTVTFSDSSTVTAASADQINERAACRSSSSGGVSEITGDCNGLSSSDAAVDDSSSRAARCLATRPCRRRRLLRPPGDVRLPINRKATLLSTVRCTSCHPPNTPCALCAGRYNNVTPIGTHLPSLEKIALLDPAFHPVLSFNADVLTSLRLSECVQHTPLVTGTESDSTSVSTMGKKGLTIKISKACLKSLPSRLSRKLVPNNSQLLDGKGRLANRPDGDYNEYRAMRGSEITKTFRERAALRDGFRRKRPFGLSSRHLGKSATHSNLKPGRPARLTQSASASSLKDALRRQSSRADFDINNIVIPYGATAAATLIDRHEYKEIVTPKWREVEPLPQLVRKSSLTSPPAKLPRLDIEEKPVIFQAGDEVEMASAPKSPVENSNEACSKDQDSEVEDLSDEMFATRHLRYEIYEKKQIQPLLSQRRRSRSNRSESDHSLTVSANPCSPDTGLCPSAETPAEPLPHACPGSDETEAEQPSVFSVNDQTILPAVDVRLLRMSSSTLALYGQTSAAVSTEVTSVPPANTVAGADSAWPERSFPLIDADYNQLLTGDSRTELRHRDSDICTRNSSASVIIRPVPFSTAGSGPLAASTDHHALWTSNSQPVDTTSVNITRL